jgi:hypothetical protein
LIKPKFITASYSWFDQANIRNCHLFLVDQVKHHKCHLLLIDQANIHKCHIFLVYQANIHKWHLFVVDWSVIYKYRILVVQGKMYKCYIFLVVLAKHYTSGWSGGCKFHLSLVYFCDTAIELSHPRQAEFGGAQTIIPKLLWVYMLPKVGMGIEIMSSK